MDLLFERHAEYLTDVPTAFERELMQSIDWDSRLILIRGPKGVGKSTLMQQYILNHYEVSDRHVLYCSADSSYFSTHTLVDTAAAFVRQGGRHLFIDEIHKYDGWSSEIKDIYDLFKGLKVVLSGSSLIQLNDGQADLSRREDVYDMPGLSFREYLWFRTGKKTEPVTLDYLLENAGTFCTEIRSLYRPLEFFSDYLRMGYYPFSFEKKRTYKTLIENVTSYIIDTELTKYRGVSPDNVRKIKALLQIISEMFPYQVDISKLSASVSIDRVTIIRYLRFLNEAKLIRNLFTEMDKISDLQKPDKILLDNTNLIYAYGIKEPEVGTVRECFFCNQLASAGHRVEYGGLKTGDFRIDKNYVIEVGGTGKDFSQIDENDFKSSALAIDNIDVAGKKKIPLWAFGFLY
ncbi:MAG: AAA family ATPase [Bacteroidaceae bacterium]|nr:AAA family ATPase [Bacteroidaceae bacterium]